MKRVIKKIIKFRDKREWKVFHNPKDLSCAIMIEAAELNEIYLWKKPGDEVDNEHVKEELADILIYTLTMLHDLDFDLKRIIKSKLRKNKVKYPKN